MGTVNPRGGKRKPTAFLFDASHWLTDKHVAMMTPTQRGIYIHLLAFEWLEGSIPMDYEDVAVLAGPMTEHDWMVVRQRFRKNGTNKRLEDERAAVAEHLERLAASRRRAAKKRWGKR